VIYYLFCGFVLGRLRFAQSAHGGAKVVWGTPGSASLRRGAITLVHFVHWRVMAERGGFEPPIQR
jgi:hypothetical protein